MAELLFRILTRVGGGAVIFLNLELFSQEFSVLETSKKVGL